MERGRVISMVIVAIILVMLGVAGWVITRTATSLDGATLKVVAAKTGHAVPGDDQGALIGLTPADALALDVRLCPGKLALPSSPPVALWTAPGSGAWARVPAEVSWKVEEKCLTSTVSAPVSAGWPGVPRGVGRWALVVGDTGNTLPDPTQPAPLWRKTGLVFDGEVVILP